MTQVRPPAVADFFYPGDPEVLERDVRGHLARAAAHIKPSPVPAKALIVPHAGYRYSGEVAASAYCELSDRASEIRRVGDIVPGATGAGGALAMTRGSL